LEINDDESIVWTADQTAIRTFLVLFASGIACLCRARKAGIRCGQVAEGAARISDFGFRERTDCQTTLFDGF
jgi:phage FluMu gp28-like protein